MKLLATTLALLAASTSLQAVKLAGDDFSYGVGSAVTSANGGFGWSGAWTTPTTTSTTTSVVAGSPNFSYTSGGTLNIPANAGLNAAFQVTNTAAASNTSALSRNFSAAISNTDIYVSFMVRYTAGALADTDSFYLYFGTAATSNARYDVGVVGLANADFGVRTSNNAGYTNTGINIANNTNPTSGSYFVVAKLSKVSTANYDSFTLWANPTSPVESQNTGVTSANATGDFANFSALGFGYGNLDGTETFQIDNLQIGTTWQDVITPVPFGVDSTAGLALLGLAAGWKIRRRRTKA